MNQPRPRLFDGITRYVSDLLRVPSRMRQILRNQTRQMNQAHSLVPNVYLGDHTALTLLQGRLKIFVDTRGNDLAPHLLIEGTWETAYTALFEKLIRPGDTVLDLGAHLGVYTLLGALATGPSGRVAAFEPNPRFAALLTRSLAVNGMAGHAQVNNVAVGAEEGVAELVFSLAWGGGGHLSPHPGHVPEGNQIQPCRVVALDDMFPDADFRVDMVKADVEGLEAHAVRGMRRLLARSPNAKVMFEFAPGMLAAQGSSAAELVQLFAEMGFRFWNIGDSSQLQAVDAAILAAMTDGVRNILAARETPAPD
ncbi:FkbM family methyltransferase [Roseomonas sp. F4]